MRSVKLAAVDPSEPAERSLRSDAQQSRAAPLEAARELMAERGPEALAVGDVFGEELRRMFSQPRNFGAQVDFFVSYFRAHPDIARIWMFRPLSNGRETEPEGWADTVSALERLARSPGSQDGIDAEMLGIIGRASALFWSSMANRRTDNEEDARAETHRFARELKRLFLFGALRPESWPELAAELEHENQEGET